MSSEVIRSDVADDAPRGGVAPPPAEPAFASPGRVLIETDVHLLVKGMYFEAKDTSPGSACLVKFTPVKGDKSFRFTISNSGPGVNKVTLKVKVDD